MVVSPLRPVTPDERAAYRRDGAVLLKAILPQNWIEQIRAGVEEAYGNPGALSTRAAAPSGPGEIRIDQMPSLSNDRLRAFVTESPAAAIAGALLGEDTVHHVLDQMFYKPAGRILPTAWHQDTPYLRVKGDGLCRLWISCDPSPAPVTVNVIRGSHLWGVEYRPVEGRDTGTVEQEVGGGFAYSSKPFDQSLPDLPKINEHLDSFDVLSWDVTPGDVLAFNGNIIHGTSREVPNHPNHRRALAVMWGTGDVKTIQRPGNAVPDMAIVRGIDLPTGERIGDHPEAFPAYALKAPAAVG